eukprot:6186777-Pleurochrysis_carterae.AAC.6
MKAASLLVQVIFLAYAGQSSPTAPPPSEGSKPRVIDRSRHQRILYIRHRGHAHRSFCVFEAVHSCVFGAKNFACCTQHLVLHALCSIYASVWVRLNCWALCTNKQR